jgi:hypothetical protein
MESHSGISFHSVLLAWYTVCTWCFYRCTRCSLYAFIIVRGASSSSIIRNDFDIIYGLHAALYEVLLTLYAVFETFNNIRGAWDIRGAFSIIRGAWDIIRGRYNVIRGTFSIVRSGFIIIRSAVTTCCGFNIIRALRGAWDIIRGAVINYSLCCRLSAEGNNTSLLWAHTDLLWAKWHFLYFTKGKYSC